MAYPTGSGTELIRRGMIDGQTNSASAFTFDGTHPTKGTNTATVATDHIITILSIIICEMSNTGGRAFSLTAYNGSSDIILLNNAQVQPKQTYVWNDRIVLHPTHKLSIVGNASSAFDVHYTYIDQNHS
jgi:hypothetical protein